MSDPIEMLPEDDNALAAELALGLLEGEDLAEARFRMAHDRGFALRVSAWHESLAALTDDITPVAPSKRIRKVLLKQMFPKQRLPLLERLWVWKGISLAALVLMGYFAMPLLRPAPSEGPAQVFATQMKGESGTLEVLAVVNSDQSGIALHRLAGVAPDGRVLELWAILPDQAPLSLGVLPEQAITRVALPEGLTGQVAQITLAITDEPLGGAPQGAPTGEIRAIGALAEL